MVNHTANDKTHRTISREPEEATSHLIVPANIRQNPIVPILILQGSLPLETSAKEQRVMMIEVGQGVTG